jgi:hypothetical protein
MVQPISGSIKKLKGICHNRTSPLKSAGAQMHLQRGLSVIKQACLLRHGATPDPTIIRS